MNVCTALDAGGDGGDDAAIPLNCGNDVLDPGEQCDQGTANANEPDTCRLDCRFPRCGDGIVDTGEACDDGNATLYDGCTPSCRAESSECVILHSGDGRGSSFSAIELAAEGPANPRTLSTPHRHTETAERSLVGCSGGIWAATDPGILALELGDTGLRAGALEPLDDASELACADDVLFAIASGNVLVRYRVADGRLERLDELELPFEARNQTRAVPFVRGESLILIATMRGGFSDPIVLRIPVDAAPLAVDEMFTLNGSIRGPGVDVSADGSALLAIHSMGCAARWTLAEGSSADSSCDIVGSPGYETVLSADASASSVWVGNDAGARLLTTSGWSEARALSGFDASLFVESSRGFVALGAGEATLLSDPPVSTLVATIGSTRGAIVVPCASF